MPSSVASRSWQPPSRPATNPLSNIHNSFEGSRKPQMWMGKYRAEVVYADNLLRDDEDATVKVRQWRASRRARKGRIREWKEQLEEIYGPPEEVVQVSDEALEASRVISSFYRGQSTRLDRKVACPVTGNLYVRKEAIEGLEGRKELVNRALVEAGVPPVVIQFEDPGDVPPEKESYVEYNERAMACFKSFYEKVSRWAADVGVASAVNQAFQDAVGGYTTKKESAPPSPTASYRAGSFRRGTSFTQLSPRGPSPLSRQGTGRKRGHYSPRRDEIWFS